MKAKLFLRAFHILVEKTGKATPTHDPNNTRHDATRQQRRQRKLDESRIPTTQSTRSRSEVEGSRIPFLDSFHNCANLGNIEKLVTPASRVCLPI